MSDVERHYRDLLGDIYPWMVASKGDPVERASEWLREWRLLGGQSYLDLGAGFGAHAEALLRADKVVTVVDLDEGLVRRCQETLRPWTDALRAQVVQADLLQYLATAGELRWDTVLCLGDTLTHLPDPAAVESLVQSSAQHLEYGGALALQWRDTSRFTLEGSARFIEVACDHQRTMHCLLEPLDEQRLRVTDLVTDVTAEGPRTRISDYVKLRLSMSWVRDVALAAGFAIESAGSEHGMCTLVLRS